MYINQPRYSKALWINSSGYETIYFSQNGRNAARFHSNGNLERYETNHGCLIGSYNFKGPNSYEPSPIYCIGRNYIPYKVGDSRYNSYPLNNMYGIGYSYMGNARFLSSMYSNSRSGWGMYCASDGDARVFLNGTRGDVVGTGHLFFRNGDLYFGNNLYGRHFSIVYHEENEATSYRGSSIRTRAIRRYARMYGDPLWIQSADRFYPDQIE